MIERRLENLLALDYPRGSARDRRRVRRLDRPDERARRGRRRAASRASGCSTARAAARSRPRIAPSARRRARWSRSRTRTRPGRPTRSGISWPTSPTPRSRTSAAGSGSRTPTGSNREGLYWRYELWLREQESRLGSITGGNGSIYALKRGDYVEVDPRWGHDLAFPYRMVQAGRRAVYQPAAHAFEEPTPTNETEYARKVRMFEHCWEITLRGSMLRRLPPGYLVSIVSHRVLRYGSGLLHVALLATSVVLAPRGLALRARAPRPARAARRLRGRRPDRALLRVRHLGDRAGALELPPPRRPGGVGSGGDPVNRARGRRARRARPRRLRARSSPPRRSPSSSRTAGRSSSGRPASARTASTSSC